MLSTMQRTALPGSMLCQQHQVVGASSLGLARPAPPCALPSSRPLLSSREQPNVRARVGAV